MAYIIDQDEAIVIKNTLELLRATHTHLVSEALSEASKQIPNLSIPYLAGKASGIEFAIETLHEELQKLRDDKDGDY